MRGTVWLTEDFCDASRVASKEGAVEAAAAAPAGPTYVLLPGQFIDTFCNTGQPVTDYFCLLLLSQPEGNVFGFGIVVHDAPYDTYRLCIIGPLSTETAECADLPLTAPDANGFRQSAVVCKPGQGPGRYSGELDRRRLPARRTRLLRVDQAGRSAGLPEEPVATRARRAATRACGPP